MLKYRTLCPLCGSRVTLATSISAVTLIDSVLVLVLLQLDTSSRLFNAGAAVIAVLFILQVIGLHSQLNQVEGLAYLRRQGVPNGVPCAWCNRKEPFMPAPAIELEPPSLHFLTWIRGSRNRPGPGGIRPDYATDGKFVYERVTVEQFDESGPRAPRYKFRRASFDSIASDLDWDELSDRIWTEVDDYGQPIVSH